jgi:serpin B
VAALTKLGMADVFDGRADLTGIAAGLHVSDAIHRANVTVDERGTEAAAVTGIAVGTAGRTGSPIIMRADRPFAWAIVHEPTGTPVFVGHVSDPTA